MDCDVDQGIFMGILPLRENAYRKNFAQSIVLQWFWLFLLLVQDVITFDRMLATVALFSAYLTRSTFVQIGVRSSVYICALFLPDK